VDKNEETGEITDLVYIRYNKKQKEWSIDHIETINKLVPA
jgi:hypothetical protein